MGPYQIETSKSREILDRLTRTLPGGNTRTAAHWPPFPLALERGSGYKVWDVDGNEFIDLLNNFAVLVHGHCHPKITEVLTKQLHQGVVFPTPSAHHAELAERICDRMPSMESIRFTNSGTEAVMMAVRAARAFTRRSKLVISTLGYHGSWEQVCVGTRPSGPGVPGVVRGLVELVRFNSIEDLESAMEKHGHEMAAIVLEPVLGAGGIITGDPAYFAAARRLADQYGCLLLLDEVITFRLALGGYQSVLGVRPDLTALGKVIGGGMPVGAFGGRKEIMSVFDPEAPTRIHHSGTFNGNLLTMVAGCASLDLLSGEEIARINALGERLAGHFETVFADSGLPGTVNVNGSLIQINLPQAVLIAVHNASLDAGLLFGGRGYLNISTVMDEAVIDEAANRFAAAVKAVAKSNQAMPVPN